MRSVLFSWLALVVLVSGCNRNKGVGSPPAPQVRPALAPVVAAAPTSLLDYVPNDAVFVYRLEPGRVLSHADAAEPWQRFAARFPFHSAPLGQEIGWLQALGHGLEDIEQIVHAASSLRFPSPEANDPEDAPDEVAEIGENEFVLRAYGLFEDAYIVRFREKAPRQALIALLFRPQQVLHQGQVYFGLGLDSPTTACHFIDERTVILGEETVVRQMLAQPKANGPLMQQLRAAEGDLVASLDFSQIDSRHWEAPVSEIAGRLKFATVAATFGSRREVSATLIAQDAKGAETVAESLKALIGQARKMVPPPEALSGAPVSFLDLVERAPAALDQIEITQQEARVEVGLADVIDRGELFDLLDLIVFPPAPRSELSAENETAAQICWAAISAAGMTNKDMHAIGTSVHAPSPHSVENQTLTLSIFSEKILDLNPEAYQQRVEELHFHGESTVDPNEIAKLLSRTAWLGYCSMLLPEHLTKATCQLEDDQARGAIWFDTGVYAGRVHYLAQKDSLHGWRIVEFSFPVRDWRFVRAEDGSWQWFDHFGRVAKDQKLPLQKLQGVLQSAQTPLKVARLTFVLKSHPDYMFYTGTNEQGAFSIELPPGEYLVQVPSRLEEVDERFHSLATTPLTAKIVEGQTELTITLPE